MAVAGIFEYRDGFDADVAGEGATGMEGATRRAAPEVRDLTGDAGEGADGLRPRPCREEPAGVGVPWFVEDGDGRAFFDDLSSRG